MEKAPHPAHVSAEDDFHHRQGRAAAAGGGGGGGGGTLDRNRRATSVQRQTDTLRRLAQQRDLTPRQLSQTLITIQPKIKKHVHPPLGCKLQPLAPQHMLLLLLLLSPTPMPTPPTLSSTPTTCLAMITSSERTTWWKT